MDVALTILFLGILIFLGNVFSRLFTLTRIPDLLFLIGIGLLIGPVLGFVFPRILWDSRTDLHYGHARHYSL